MSVFQSDPIVLGSSKPFATGDHRLCFKHPSDGSLCVKVNRQGKAQALKANAPLYKKFRSVDSFDDNKIGVPSFFSSQRSGVTHRIFGDIYPVATAGLKLILALVW